LSTHPAWPVAPHHVSRRDDLCHRHYAISIIVEELDPDHHSFANARCGGLDFGKRQGFVAIGVIVRQQGGSVAV